MNYTGKRLLTDSFPKISTHLGFFGSGSDRYNPGGCKNAASPTERIRLASMVRGLEGAEWYSIDITMRRGDAVKACQQSVINIQRLCLLTRRLDRETVLSNLTRTDHPENLRVVSDIIFSTLGA
jgi:hypothetical protein